jgi:hypothetical protein
VAGRTENEWEQSYELTAFKEACNRSKKGQTKKTDKAPCILGNAVMFIGLHFSNNPASINLEYCSIFSF